MEKTNLVKLNLNEEEWDTIVIGTGLPESLSSAISSNEGEKVLVVDIDSNYSSSLKNFNFKEFIAFVSATEKAKSTKLSPFSNFQFEISNSILFDEAMESSKLFSIDLQPRLLMSRSTATSMLIAANMDDYLEFNSLKGIFHKPAFDSRIEIPCSKGEIFTNSSLSALEKRSLFKFLQEVVGIYQSQFVTQIDQNATEDFQKENKSQNIEFYKSNKDKSPTCFYEKLGLVDKLVSLIHVTIAHSPSNLKCLVEKVGRYGMSIGVHSKFPYLIVKYGVGDIPQAYARVAAVRGATFILGKELEISKIEFNEEKAKYEISCNFSNSGVIRGSKVVLGCEYSSLYSYPLKAAPSISLIKRLFLLIRIKKEEKKIETPCFLTLNNKVCLILDSSTWTCPPDYLVVQSKGNEFDEQFINELLSETNGELVYCLEYDQKQERMLTESTGNITLMKDYDFDWELETVFNEFQPFFEKGMKFVSAKEEDTDKTMENLITELKSMKMSEKKDFNEE